MSGFFELTLWVIGIGILFVVIAVISAFIYSKITKPNQQNYSGDSIMQGCAENYSNAVISNEPIGNGDINQLIRKSEKYSVEIVNAMTTISD